MVCDPKLLQEKFEYDPDTGKIYKRLGNQTYSLRGAEAFKTPNWKGYLKGTFKGKSYFAHRVAWAMYHGEWPQGQIDHINGDRQDNRIGNLRVVSNLENCLNLGRKPPRTSKFDSGVNGVHWNKQNSKWMVRLRAKGKWLYFGCYTDLDKAIAVRRRAEAAHGFHPNHGRRPATQRKSDSESLFVLPSLDESL